ncbi:3beta-hydroxysteroid-dehydrogenase/decarboxylase [Cornus florida]|uniref:3beta-hydroxysteroid- dehydrogenase/decarboxylase n=1 Tax=Cornus florida TaxID=4283 RepID=UPI00289A084E|nr:3beta-hydroxysteroid-dehydrogenase/decarboxylase [Cornus florida]XP_059654685.1 3beta-hydroxysteroid-dehydrogenase/decarboxylase [Cornus florida]
MVIGDNLRTCVVLGGRGFVGRTLVLRLLKLGNWIVRIADSAQSLQLDPSEHNSILSEALATDRASYFHVDVRNKPQIIKAIEGSSVVFYMEATNSYTNDFYFCYTIIVQGAKNVVNVCRECKVKRLIYNSSTDVVFDGSHDIQNGEESLPYPRKFDDMLSDLKAQAEALILFANDINGLLTCALRPSNVFGPGDTQLVPFLVNKAKSSWAKFIIGSGENMSEFTYVENVAHAHICAEEALCSRMVSVSGKAFFITNLEPVKFWDFVSLILEGLGYQRPMIKLPAWIVWYIVLIAKWMYAKMEYRLHDNSMSVHGIFQLAICTRTFNCAAAKKHMGYSPVVSLEEGVKLTTESFSHLAEDPYSKRCIDSDEESKVEKLLGSGKVAEILLWRDEKKTFTYFLVLVLLFYWFFLCGRTFVSSAAKLLLLFAIFLYGYGILPSNVFGFTIPRISLSCFQISEVDMRNSITSIAYMWNSVIHVTRSLAQGEDWNIFLKVALSLYFLNLMLSQYLTVAIGAALVLAFTSFFVYEQYEVEIDAITKVLFNSTREIMGLLMRNLPTNMTSFLHSYGTLHERQRPAMAKHFG